jgi:hypothetical protein
VRGIDTQEAHYPRKYTVHSKKTLTAYRRGICKVKKYGTAPYHKRDSTFSPVTYKQSIVLNFLEQLQVDTYRRDLGESAGTHSSAEGWRVA